MFEKRLKIILGCFAGTAMVFLARLIDLQVVHAEHYRERAAQVLLQRPRMIPFPRGRILDRTGRVLARDEPCWQVSVAYDVLAGDASGEDGPDDRVIEATWDELARFGDVTREVIDARRRDIVERVSRWRWAVTQARGYDVPIREERMAHPVLTGLDDQRQIVARQRFADRDWVTIEDATRRTYDPHPSLGHVLGQLGAATEEDLLNDPLENDALGRLLPTEQVGVTGVEYAAERTLRGRRGVFQFNRRGEVVRDVAPQPGEDVVLTLHLELQERLYALFEEMLPSVAPDSPGGSIVVLDVGSREVLALVSFPGYDANTFHARYDALRDDTVHTPLRFRAVANVYEPGSIIKPLTCLAGLGCGVIDPTSTIHCDGYYDRDRYPDSYRCWKSSVTGQRKAHGDVPVADALAYSCNVFMYHVGDRLGPDRLCSYLDMAGVGRSTGIGLREESVGINPTPSWLMQHRNQPASRGHARNFAIGQGEIMVTPLQAANLMALYAGRQVRYVSLIREGTEGALWRLPLDNAAWSAMREGLFRVTNDPHGTAYHTAHWSDAHYALCGKTGSATTFPSPTHYRVRYRDAPAAPASEVVPAKVKQHAVDRFRALHPNAQFDPEKDVTVESTWPPPKPSGSDEHHAHAWFAGYLQPLGPDGRPRDDRTPPIAFAVLIEFGGSGGYTTGPVAREIARVIVQTLGDDLDPDSVGPGEGT